LVFSNSKNPFIALQGQPWLVGIRRMMKPGLRSNGMTDFPSTAPISRNRIK
jgi:hypothetical protein